MLCRVADDLFWLSRYVERAIAVSRLLDVTEHLGLDAGELDYWEPLVRDGAARSPAEVARYLAVDEDNPDSLLSCVRRARTLARGIREAIASEMWEVLNTLHTELQAQARGAHRIERGNRRARERLQLVQGLADATMAHDEPWLFITLGTSLERAASVARLLKQQAHLLEPAAGSGDPTVASLAVLRSCGAAEAYARFYSLRVDPVRIVEFLVLNAIFPQSIRFSLAAARLALREVAALRTSAGNDPGPAPRTLGRIHGLVENTAVDDVYEGGLPRFLDSLLEGIAVGSEQVTATYLRDQPTSSRVTSVARATALIAQQMQQQQS